MNVAKSIGRPDREEGKNTNCGAGFHFRLENVVGSKSMREDREKYPLWLKIQFDHNHSLNRAEYFKFLSVSDETAQYYTELFSQGLLPGSLLGGNSLSSQNILRAGHYSLQTGVLCLAYSGFTSGTGNTLIEQWVAEMG